MKGAVEKNSEVTSMTNEQSTRYELLARFYEIQTALDKLTDPESIKILEAQKKEITERLATK